MIIKKVKTSIKKLTRPTDRTEKYWTKAANADVENVMMSICDKFDRNDFETKKDSLIFTQNIKLDKEMKVLDLACGMGRTCRWVAPHVGEYIGADFIPEMIEKAKEYNIAFQNARFVTNNGKTLDGFDRDYFDLVYSELSFQYMNKPIQESYVKEIFRVLKCGGLFYVQIPRLEFYKDKTYSRTKKETDELFKKFSIEYEDTTEAYYFIRVKKEETSSFDC